MSKFHYIVTNTYSINCNISLLNIYVLVFYSQNNRWLVLSIGIYSCALSFYFFFKWNKHLHHHYTAVGSKPFLSIITAHSYWWRLLVLFPDAQTQNNHTETILIKTLAYELRFSIN